MQGNAFGSCICLSIFKAGFDNFMYDSLSINLPTLHHSIYIHFRYSIPRLCAGRIQTCTFMTQRKAHFV